MNHEPPSPRQLRILHLEDNLLDAELTHEALLAEFPACHIERVETREDFVRTLAATDFDLILSDFSLPGFNGLVALELSRQIKPDVPYIFLSGTIGEENAVKALRNGAIDYVIKDRPGRLIPAVRRALKERRDQADRKRLETQFLRAQRLESVGMLAGGIAHDLNNVLAPMLMAVDLVRHRTADEEIRKLMGILETSVNHGASLLRQVLAFARGVEGERSEMKVDAVFSDVVSLLSGTLPRTVTIQSRVASGTSPICSNATQFGQVLMNLCINARDAMPSGGRITLAASNVEVDEAEAASRPDVKPGSYVLVTVADTGTGIPPDVLEKIFDPFFTTKGIGSGTGLGLSTVLGIVQSHGGFVDVRTHVGQGTEFRLHFPSAAKPNPRQAETGAPGDVRNGAGRKVLVVDDEAGIRASAEGLLKAYGYVPLLAADAPSAIEAFAAGRGEIDAVVVDVMLPGMRGREIVERLRAVRPDVRIVALCGMDGERLGVEDEPGRLALLRKPMSGLDFLRAVERVLP